MRACLLSCLTLVLSVGSASATSYTVLIEGFTCACAPGQDSRLSGGFFGVDGNGYGFIDTREIGDVSGFTARYSGLFFPGTPSGNSALSANPFPNFRVPVAGGLFAPATMALRIETGRQFWVNWGFGPVGDGSMAADPDFGGAAVYYVRTQGNFGGRSGRTQATTTQSLTITPSPVPLPAPALLLIGGLGALVLVKRKSARQA